MDLVAAIRRRLYRGSMHGYMLVLVYRTVVYGYIHVHLRLWPRGEFWDMQILFLRQSRLDKLTETAACKQTNKETMSR